MNVRDFEYLIAVQEQKNFSKASLKCHISQPALSQQIKKIEDQLGFKIFERDKKSIITTAKGLEVIEQARDIVASYEEIKNISNNNTKIKIALIPTICPYLLPHIVDKIHLKLPKIEFYFLELKTEELITKLKRGEIDIGIIAFFRNLIDDKTNYTKLYDEEFLLTLPKHSHLTKDDFPKILEEEKILLLEEGNCMSDNIKDICSTYKNSSFNEFYATNIETVKNMIRINDSAALLPKLSCTNNDQLKHIALTPKKIREVGMVTRSSYTNRHLSHTISNIIQESVATLR